jgi:hypothetical protein
VGGRAAAAAVVQAVVAGEAVVAHHGLQAWRR